MTEKFLPFVVGSFFYGILLYGLLVFFIVRDSGFPWQSVLVASLITAFIGNFIIKYGSTIFNKLEKAMK